LQPERLTLHAAEVEAPCGCEDHRRLAEATAGALDDPTVRYVLETRPHFEDLRHAVGQVAGMLVLAAAGAKTVTPEHPLLGTARATLDRVADGVGAARPSARAAHHHRHLVAATGALGLALRRAAEELHPRCVDRECVDAVLEPLKAAYRNLAW